MAKLGFCETRPVMKTECTKTCNVCPGSRRLETKTTTPAPKRGKNNKDLVENIHGGVVVSKRTQR